MYRILALLGTGWGVYLLFITLIHGGIDFLLIEHWLFCITVLSLAGLMLWGVIKKSPSTDWFMTVSSATVSILIISGAYFFYSYYPGFPDLEPSITR